MKCARDACPNTAARGDQYCADALCKRVREALHARSRGSASTRREVAPIVSRDEQTAALASQPAAPLPSRVECAPVMVPGVAASARPAPVEPPPAPKAKPEPQPAARCYRLDGPYWDALNALSRQLIEAECARHTNATAVASALGLSPQSLSDIARRLGIELPNGKRLSRQAKIERLRAKLAALEAKP